MRDRDQLLEGLRAGALDEEQRLQLVEELDEIGTLEDEALLIRLARDPLAEVRSSAMHALGTRVGRASANVEAVAWDRLTCDPDEGVRISAVGCLSRYFAGTRSRRVYRRLKALLLKREVSPFLKLSLYDAILAVVGEPADRWVRLSLDWREFSTFEPDLLRLKELETGLDES